MLKSVIIISSSLDICQVGGAKLKKKKKKTMLPMKHD